MSVQVKGVDISEFNGGVDFQALKNAGVKFVIIRTGFGSDYPGQQDKRFEENVKKAEAAGMPWGVYHYAYATSKSGGIAEANHCLRLLNGRKPLYGVWYDMEDNSTLGGDLAAAAQGFCDTIEKAGCYAGVYASTSWWKNNLTSATFDNYDKWVAQYYTACQYEKPFGMWQYTSTWSIGGKDFDGNWAYKDYPAIVKAMNGQTTPETPETEDDDMTEAQVKALATQATKEYLKSLQTNNASEWSKEAREWAISIGLIAGSDPLPDGSPNYMWPYPTTREAMVQFFYNFAKAKGLV